MKRTFATLGVVGLGLIGLTAPAMAAPDMVVVCHDDDGTWAPMEFNVNGVGGHAQHGRDIIPPTPKAPSGLNWTNAGKITYIANCAALPPGEEPPVYPEVPPVVNQPVENPPAENNTPVENPAVVNQPVVETQVVTPVVEQSPVVPPAAVAPPAAPVVVPEQPAAAQPRAAVPQQAAAGAVAPAATTSLGTNQGYNAQTAVGGSDGAPSWLAGLGALFAAGAAVMFRRKSHSARLAD